MTFENLVVLLLFGFVALLGVILPWLTKRREGRVPEAIKPEAPKGARRLEIPSPPLALAPWQYRAKDAPSPAVMPPVATRRQQRSPVTSKSDVRRGIVLMTLLGPCRALEPSDPASK